MKNSVVQEKNLVFLRNLVFLSDKLSFSENRIFHQKNRVFRKNPVFLAEKLGFSEKNRVYLILVTFACHKRFQQARACVCVILFQFDYLQ